MKQPSPKVVFMPYSRCRGAQISGVAEVGENMRESRSFAFAGSVLTSALNSRVSAKVAACCALASSEPGMYHWPERCVSMLMVGRVGGCCFALRGCPSCVRIASHHSHGRSELPDVEFP